MRRTTVIWRCCVATASLLPAGTAVGDMLVYTGIEMRSGAIDGAPLVPGDLATVTIEFEGGQTAYDSGHGIVFDLGRLDSARYAFALGGLYSVDAPQDNLHFGSPFDFDLAFFDSQTWDLGMLSGTTAGEAAGLGPLVGETIGDMFNRLGDGSSITFLQPIVFQMLNPSLGGLNGGTSFVTQQITSEADTVVTLTYIPVPTCPALAAFAMLGVVGSRCRR